VSATASDESLPAFEDMPWLELSTPEDQGAIGGRVPLVEVRGRAGTKGRAAVDVVLVFDLSESTLYPSGIDVDRDGVVGRLRDGGTRNAFGTPRPSWTWTTDSDDTIVSAELEAGRRLLRRLASARARVGLVGFAGNARELCDVGPVEDALATLNAIVPRLDTSGTNLGSAIRSALRLLDRSSRRFGAGRRQVVIVLSDGRPNLPAPAIHARAYALSGAEWAREMGVRIYGYALGPEPKGISVLEEVSLASHGAFTAVSRVGDVVEHLPYVDFGGITGVSMTNRTLGRSGRAVRLFGDGTFDGFVPLEVGENLIEVEVTSERGVRLRTLRSVAYDPDGAGGRSERELARLLRRRTLETELASRVRAARVTRHRSVDVRTTDAEMVPIEVEDAPAKPDTPDEPVLE